MAPQLHRLGVGAKVTCLSKFVHPSQHIRDKYPNPVSGHCLEGCVVVCQELKKVSRRDQLCIIVHHDEFKTADGTIVELHAVKRHWKVVEECDSDFFFDDPVAEEEREEEPVSVALPDVIDQAINGQSTKNNTIEALRGVVDIDDNNEPAPENVPQQGEASDRVLGTEWGHDGFCYRRSSNLGQHCA